MKVVRWLVSFALGCLVGVILHYALYRMSLPIEPFIYMAFDRRREPQAQAAHQHRRPARRLGR